MTEFLVVPLAGLLGFMALKSLKDVSEYGDFDPAVLKGVDYKKRDVRTYLPDQRSPGMDFKAYIQPKHKHTYKKGVSIHDASYHIF